MNIQHKIDKCDLCNNKAEYIKIAWDTTILGNVKVEYNLYCNKHRLKK